MSNVFLVSDLHLGHQGITQFLRPDGTKVRPWDNIEDMDNALIQNWNETVKASDKVYVLGDCVINRKHLWKLGHLNGNKELIKGNHDVFRLEEYTPYFKDIKAYHTLDNKLLCHIPVHPTSKGRYSGNIHGHLHTFNVMLPHAPTKQDPWYFNVSVEQHSYRPIALDEILKRMGN